jgi:hypothetical protein
VRRISGSTRVNSRYGYYYLSSYTNLYSWLYPDGGLSQILQDLHRDYKAGTLDTLTPTECINQYATAIQSNRRHLLLVASNNNFPTVAENKFINGSHVYWADTFQASNAQAPEQAADSYGWICSAVGDYSSTCSNEVDGVRNNATAWRVGRYCPETGPCIAGVFPVEYCLSQRAEPHCRLQYNMSIAVIVTVLNLGKSCVGDLHVALVGAHTSTHDYSWKRREQRHTTRKLLLSRTVLYMPLTNLHLLLTFLL